MNKYEDIFLQENGDRLIFGNTWLQITISKSSGDWINFSMHDISHIISSRNSSDMMPMIEGYDNIQRNDSQMAGFSASIYKNKHCAALHIKKKLFNDLFEFNCTYILYPHRAVLERTASIKYLSAEKKTIKRFFGFRMLLPDLTLGKTMDCEAAAPGPFWPATFTPEHTPYDSLVKKNIHYHTAPDGCFGLFLLANKKLKATLAAFIKTNGDVNNQTILHGNGKSFSIEQIINRAEYIHPGQIIRCDTQQVSFSSNIMEAIGRYHQVASQRMSLASFTPAWVKDAVILEIYPDYFKDGFKGITEKLPLYKQVGFNTIYLMPHWKGGYSPVDLYAINTKYGTSQELKELIDTAHRLHMHVLFDMVIHGFNKCSPVIKEHADFFYRDYNDTLMIHPAWGSVMTDFMNKDYQRYMKNYVLYEQRTFHNDGFRVDAASYKGPNWNKNLSYPAYRSGSASPLLMKIMLDALRVRQSDAVLLSEVFGPAFYTVDNFVHDNQTEAVSFLLKEIKAGHYHFGQYADHLRDVYSLLPKGAVRVFYSRNHDTSWFYFFDGYTRGFMCFEAVHALFGIPEVFAGDPDHGPNPDDDPAVFQYYQQLFKARKDYPECRDGEIILNGISCSDDNVFAGIRKDSAHTSLVLVSADSIARQVNVHLPAYIKVNDKIVGKDAIHHTLIKGVIHNEQTITVGIQPWQVAIFRLDECCETMKDIKTKSL